ncbi:MAG: hypothetical protein V4764_12005 [Burkholderia sp.]
MFDRIVQSLLAAAHLVSPPAGVSIVFCVAYLLVGIPVHVRLGTVSRNVYGTLAGVFAGLLYMTLILGGPR